MFPEEMDLTSPLEGRISETTIESMVEELAQDELISIRMVDAQKILLSFLKQKYKKMVPCDLESVYNRRFYDLYDDVV
jgi:hypothetical protein